MSDREAAVRTWLGHRWGAMVRLPSDEWDDQPDRPRALVECDDSALGWAVEKTLERAGYEVASCPGPSATNRCALLASGRCELQEGADVIVNCLGADARRGWELARRTVATRPECPLVVDATGIRPEPDGLPDGVAVLLSPWSGPTLVDAVHAATARAERDRFAP